MKQPWIQWSEQNDGRCYGCVQADSIIKELQQVIENQTPFLPVFKRIEEELTRYEGSLDDQAKRESQYIEALLTSAIGLIRDGRMKVVHQIKGELQKISEFYIENVLKGVGDETNGS